MVHVASEFQYSGHSLIHLSACCVWRVGCVVGGCNFVAIECGRHG